MASLSVIIPTHRRPEILRECLRHLADQTIAGQLEVIVVSDGPDPETAKLFQNTGYGIRDTKYLEIPKSQQGVARNAGVKHATSPLILFIGDDIFLEPDACEKHLATHQKISAIVPQLQTTNYQLPAVLGYTTWDPSLQITPVMRWLEASGWQFGYPFIEQYAHDFLPTKIQERFSYTSHISVPAEVARRFPFREDVELYGWEDIEWGIRLKEAQIRLYYEPDAEALHHHHMTLEDSLKRAEILGRSLVQIAQLNPIFQWKLSPWRLFLQRLLAFLPNMNGMHRYAFLRGVRQAKNQKQVNQ